MTTDIMSILFWNQHVLIFGKIPSDACISDWDFPDVSRLCKIEVRRLNCALPDQWLHRIPVQEIMVFFYTSDVNRKLAI